MVVDHPVHLGVIGRGDLAGQERFRDHQQRIGKSGGGHQRGPRSVCGMLPVRGAVVRVFQVPGGGAQGLQQHRALQRRQPEGVGQRSVILEPPGQPTLDPGSGVVGVADPAVGTGLPVELAGGHRAGDLGQVLLGVRGGDPGQRPDFGV
jgi:hypothetical protein